MSAEDANVAATATADSAAAEVKTAVKEAQGAIADAPEKAPEKAPEAEHGTACTSLARFRQDRKCKWYAEAKAALDSFEGSVTRRRKTGIQQLGAKVWGQSDPAQDSVTISWFTPAEHVGGTNLFGNSDMRIIANGLHPVFWFIRPYVPGKLVL